LLQCCDLLVLVRLQLVVSALADAAGHEGRGERGACSVQSPSVHFHLLFQMTPLTRCKYSICEGRSIAAIGPVGRGARNWTMVQFRPGNAGRYAPVAAGRVGWAVENQPLAECSAAGLIPARSAMRTNSASDTAPIFCITRPRCTL